MFDYLSYGLHIRSEIQIPEFVSLRDAEDAGEPDVEIRLGRVDRTPPETNRNGVRVTVGREEAHFYWEKAGHYLVRDGRLIIVEPGVAEEDLFRLPLLGVVFGALLAQRGFEVLHASAVEVDGSAVGLIGDKGMGKSTTAAAFHHAGHQAVADDVLALYCGASESGAVMVPAFPHLKLWPQAAAHVGADPEDLPALHSLVTKVGLRLSDEFPSSELRVERLYVLDWGERTETRAMSPGDAFASIAPHTFARRYAPASGATAGSVLRSCSDIINRVQVRRLIRRPDLTELRSIVRAVEEDIEQAVAECEA